MDKKLLLSPNLARIMVDYIPEVHALVKLHPVNEVVLKSDGSPVTELDLKLSEMCEQVAKTHLPGVTFYSEEKFSLWSFPLLAVDPIDGTKEYLAGRPEWVLSLGLFNSQDFSGQGWIFNPITHELFDDQINAEKKIFSDLLVGEVSRTEWEKGLFKCIAAEKVEIKPVGSIAYKLGRLSAGKSDFVISLEPKNIWDIAGGTLLCQNSGIKFFSEGKLVTKVKEKYYPPLIWCCEEVFVQLSSLL